MVVKKTNILWQMVRAKESILSLKRDEMLQEAAAVPRERELGGGAEGRGPPLALLLPGQGFGFEGTDVTRRSPGNLFCHN